MGEFAADKFGVEKPPREFTRKERELLRADPAFAEWLDHLNNLNRNLNEHGNEHQRPEL